MRRSSRATLSEGMVDEDMRKRERTKVYTVGALTTRLGSFTRDSGGRSRNSHPGDVSDVYFHFST